MGGRGFELERITGDNLGDLLTTHGAVPGERAVELAIAILDALARVHAAGFVHRDLKPDNLVVRADGRVTVIDLGLARRVPTDPTDPTRAGIQVGSLEYMPPEQLRDAALVDARADLYAFGCVLYELVAGRPPFLGEARALARAHAALRPSPLGAVEMVPAALEAIVHRCLEKQPARRPATALELRGDLMALRAAPATRPQGPASRSVLREGTQPVVLLWVELPRVDRVLLSMLATRKVAVISQRGRRVLGAVVGAEHPDPAGTAIATARELAAAGARIVLHLEALRVTPRGRGLALKGAAVEHPEGWLPSASWTGVVLTRALATVTQASTRPSELGAGFVRLGDPGEATELFGREPLLAELAADAAVALAGAGPGFALIVGELAVGKSAVAAALLPRLRELGVRIDAAPIPPPGAARASARALAELIGTPAGPAVRALGDALRAAARAQPTAIVLDDLHLADHELLDALEYATLGGEPLPLWILGLGSPRLDQRRPGLGTRAERHRRDVLPPLDEEAAVAMTAALLRPAAYPPLRALRQIVALARGNPLHLRALAREIHDRGAIRSRPNGEHFLDTTALESLPPLALGPWLAARELAPLTVELVALARVCAVLGEELDREELAAVVAIVEARGGATTTIDVEVGLHELITTGIVTTIGTCGARWGFTQALLLEGIYATTHEDERRVLHEAALAYWQRRSGTEPAIAERIARHAEAVGARRIAASAFATLGERAHVEHRTLDADQAWQGAIRNLDAHDPDHGRALIGRARARAKLQRIREALADLEHAYQLAERTRDEALQLEILLEQATALDFHEEFTRSKAIAEEAARRLRAAPTLVARFGLEVDFARARGWFRDQAFAEAEPRLREVRRAAAAAVRPELEIDAGLLLGCVLVERGAHDEAEQLFGEVIAACERCDDRFHLIAAYINRAWLWSARGQIERVAESLRVVVQLAREAGLAFLERAATYNLAEDRLWHGDAAEALALAHRSLALQQSHGEGTTRLDRILLARIHAARHERRELAAMLATIPRDELTEDEARILTAIEAITRADHELPPLDELAVPLRLELLHLAAGYDRLTPAQRARARALAITDPIWSRRAHDF